MMWNIEDKRKKCLANRLAKDGQIFFFEIFFVSADVVRMICKSLISYYLIVKIYIELELGPILIQLLNV